MNSLFRRLSIRQRLLALVALVVVGTVVLEALSLLALRSNLMEDRRLKTRHVVETAASLVRHFRGLETRGLIDRATAQRQAIDAVRGLRYDGEQYFWINDLAPRMVLHPYKPELEGTEVGDLRDADGKALFREMVQTVRKAGAGYVDYLWPRPGVAGPQPKTSYVSGVPEWGWVIGSGIYVDDVEAIFWAECLRQLLPMAVVLGTLVLVALSIVSGISRPLRRTVSALDDIAEGEGDLTVRLAAEGKDELASLSGSFNRFVQKISELVGEVRAAAEAIHSSANDIAAGNLDLSRRTEEQAASLEQTAAGVEQLGATVRQNSANAAEADRIAAGARTQAQRAGQVMTSANQAMQEMSENSRRVSEIIGVIDGIAFQTNLLALNAAVEAARAGEHGRGFAVVAGEVRTLALRSAQSAREIKQLIGESVTRMQEGARLAEASSAALGEIFAAVERVSRIVEGIAAASREQADGVDQISRAVSQMDTVTQRNAALVEQAAAASRTLEEEANGLMGKVARFRI